MSFLPLRKEEEFTRQVHLALEQWKDAQNYFENVTDPDQIDYAIFVLETARRRYQFLLKRARELDRLKNQIV